MAELSDAFTLLKDSLNPPPKKETEKDLLKNYRHSGVYLNEKKPICIQPQFADLNDAFKSPKGETKLTKIDMGKIDPSPHNEFDVCKKCGYTRKIHHIVNHLFDKAKKGDLVRAGGGFYIFGETKKQVVPTKITTASLQVY